MRVDDTTPTLNSRLTGGLIIARASGISGGRGSAADACDGQARK
jgi:hypothetical protein